MVSPTEDADLKTETGQLNTEDSPNSEDVTIENSSGSETSEEDASTFDVVMKAIGGEEEETEDGSNSEEDETADPDDESKDEEKDDADQTEEPSEEELKSWKPKTRQRFEKLQELYSSEKKLREEAEVGAGHYKQFTEFLTDNRISQDEANNLFQIGALMKNDPVRALEMMTPHYNALLEITGNILPPDLNKQVNDGYITKEAALELSRRRANEKVTNTIASEKQTHQKQVQQNDQQTQTASMQSALSDWERKWSSSDPDYTNKKTRVLDHIELSLARANRNGTLPKTVDEAIKLAEDARKAVEADMRSLMPKKVVTTVDGGSAVNQVPEAKNTVDVIMNTLGQ